MNGSPAPASQKLGAKLGRSDDLQAGPGDQPRGALVKWPATTAALRSQAELRPHPRGWRAIRDIFYFQLPIADFDWHQHLSRNGRKQLAIGNRNLAIL